MSDRSSKIEILLASYNAEKYIVPQIDSILNQSYEKVSIIISDDGSTDKTLNILRNFRDKHENITLIQNNSENKGHLGNFSYLSSYAKKGSADYFCFSDQDDVWHSDKLTVLMEKMALLEKKHGKKTPILVHSDLRVVNSNLEEIAPSFIRYQGLPNPAKHQFSKLLLQNIVTGCALMINRALLEKATPIPEEALVHDWWFALCAKYFGILYYIDTPLIDYRQHGLNSIGAISFKDRTSFFKKHIYQVVMNYPSYILSTKKQANTLITRAEKQEIINVEAFNEMVKLSNIQKLRGIDRIKFANGIINDNTSLIGRLFQYFSFWLVKWL